ncbi:MAG: TIGR03936 family radical SAM-associated protein, partial [Nocardioides sp.]
MREQPEQQAPPVQRLRIRYAKRGRLRFTSHRDFSRAFERAIVRARLPMAYSSGFNPHPRISYAGAAPTGAASEAEYLEIGLAQPVDAGVVRQTLAASLPPGLDIVDVVVAPLGALADQLRASHWQIEIDRDLSDTQAAIAVFLALDASTVERMTKRGLRTFDCRAAVLSLRA